MKTITRSKRVHVPVTRNGETHYVPEDVQETVPAVPFDWDRAALRAVYGITLASLSVAVTWSMVSIGDLLSDTAPQWAAYMAAGFFDLTWITFMLLQWISRYDQEKHETFRNAGWGALVVSMILISVNGYLHGSLAAGIAGSGISLAAKVLWTSVMSHTSVKLSGDTLKWFRAARDTRMADHAVQGMQTQLDRMSRRSEQAAAARAHALGQQEGTSWDVSPDVPGDTGTRPGGHGGQACPAVPGREPGRLRESPAHTGCP